MTIATKLAAERKEKTVRDKETPSINTVIEVGMAEMKAAGLDDRKVYTACAELMRRLADRALQLERDLAAANERIDVLLPLKRQVTELLERAEKAEAEVKAMREKCAKVCDAIAKVFPRSDVSFDRGYAMGAERCAKEIRAALANKESRK